MTMTTTTTPTPDERIEAMRLYVDSISAMPQRFTWDSSTHADLGDHDDDAITWSFVEHRAPDDGDEADCDECGQTITYSVDEWRHADPEEEDHEPKPNDEWHREYCEGPMMNYWYPLDIDDMEAAADLIAHLPLCAVEVDGETGIALTGGGMDLSWEICEAYIALGSYPPFHFVSQLPKMADRWTDEHALVAAAGRKVCEIVAGWAEFAAQRLADTADWMENRRWIEEQERRNAARGNQ